MPDDNDIRINGAGRNASYPPAEGLVSIEPTPEKAALDESSLRSEALGWRVIQGGHSSQVNGTETREEKMPPITYEPGVLLKTAALIAGLMGTFIQQMYALVAGDKDVSIVAIALDEIQKSIDLKREPETAKGEVVDFDLIGDGEPDLRYISKAAAAHHNSSAAINRSSVLVWGASLFMRMVPSSLISSKKVP